LYRVKIVLKFRVVVFPLLIILFLGIGVNVYAEKTHVIKIPSGASDPNAPFFWSEKNTGITTGEITVHPGDSVTWENADTAFHTITSVTREGEIDGLFDSGLFTAGKSYTRQFPQLGDFFYFCSIHPWMTGVVHVVKNPGSVQTIHNVGSGLSDAGVGYEVKYILDTSLEDVVEINRNDNTITFRISDGAQNDQLTLILPTEIIENPNNVWVDGTMTTFLSEDTQTGKKLIVPISADAKEIKVMGTRVIPEFGFFAMGILSASIFSVMLIARSKLKLL